MQNRVGSSIVLGTTMTTQNRFHNGSFFAHY